MNIYYIVHYLFTKYMVIIKLQQMAFNGIFCTLNDVKSTVKDVELTVKDV